MRFPHTSEKAGDTVPACLSFTPQSSTTHVGRCGATTTKKGRASSSWQLRTVVRPGRLPGRASTKSGDGCELSAWPPSLELELHVRSWVARLPRCTAGCSPLRRVASRGLYQPRVALSECAQPSRAG